jgi:uncharacterized protein YbaR (Trm112 family)
MFLPLVDILRCPAPHEETWLVASIDRAADRDLLEGTLGCPRCHAEYHVRSGIVLFDDGVSRPPYTAPRETEAVRLAAALDLTEARMTAVLHGAWGVHAPLIVGMSPAQLLLLNAPDGIVSGDGVSLARARTAPLARASVDAAAFDATATPELVASIVASLRSGGRLLGPVSAPVPDGLTELARDDDVWVAAVESSGVTSAPIQLRKKK